jgi:hypothetical protein
MSEAINWYDGDEVKQLKEKYDAKFRSILKRKIEARQKGDKAAHIKVIQALARHLEKGQSYEKKAEETGAKW